MKKIYIKKIDYIYIKKIKNDIYIFICNFLFSLFFFFILY